MKATKKPTKPLKKKPAAPKAKVVNDIPEWIMNVFNNNILENSLAHALNRKTNDQLLVQEGSYLEYVIASSKNKKVNILISINFGGEEPMPMYINSYTSPQNARKEIESLRKEEMRQLKIREQLQQEAASYSYQ